jgi:hypothetical protein
MASFLTERYRLTKVSVATAAGTTAVNSDSVDMEDDNGYDGVFFFTTVLAITASGVQSINLAQSADDSTFADLEGTGVTIADDDDNQTFGVDLWKPSDRYVRLEIARATQNSAFGEIYALQYHGSKLPITQNVADTITIERHATPAEGTA